jgi:SET domain-containing protein
VTARAVAAAPPEEGGLTEIRRDPRKGRGVFARRRILPEELIEAAPAIVFEAADCALLDRTVVGHYYFAWEEEGAPAGRGALALGILTLCNHAPEPRARVHRNFRTQSLELVAIDSIAPGEEITIDYGCALWFDPVE